MREAVEKKVLSENDRLAAALRQRYRDEGILCVNLVSVPGSGKTMLLEKTLATFPNDTAVAVLTGDLQTDNNPRRLARYGFPERQIVTGGTCHLDARVVDRHLNEMGFRGPVDRECRQPGLSFELRPWESGQDCAAERDRWLGALQQKVQHQTAAAIT